MENYVWIVWLILGAVLIIAEIFSTGFVLLWFGIGALAAALANSRGCHQPSVAIPDFCSGLNWADRCVAHNLRQLFFA